MDKFYISREFVEENWEPSIGEELDKIHFREPCPSKKHAVCSENSVLCEVHEDSTNPHCGLGDAVKHFLEWKWSPVILIWTIALSVNTASIMLSREIKS